MKAAFLITAGLFTAISSAQTLTYDLVSFHSAKPGVYDIFARYPRFKSQGQLGNKVTRVVADMTTDACGEFQTQTEKDHPGYQGPKSTWTYHVNSVIASSTARMISLYTKTDTFPGGAHPTSFYTVYNYWLSPGGPKEFKIQDLLAPGIEKTDISKELVLPKLRKMGAQWAMDESITDLTEEQLNTFVVTPKAITWMISPAVVGPHAQGRFEVKFFFDELRRFLRFDTALNGLISPIHEGEIVTGLFQGQVSFHEDMLLPDGCTLQLKLTDSQGRQLGRYEHKISRKPPFSFNISYNRPAGGMDEAKLSGTISRRGKTLFSINQTVKLKDRGPFRMIKSGR